MYGWHRYYLVWVYMKHKDNVPKPRPQLDPLPIVTIQLPIYNEMYVVDRLVEAVVPDRLPARAARNPGARRLHRRDARDCRAGGPPLRRAGLRHQLPPPRRPHRLQGRRARGRPQGRARRVRRDLRRRLRAAARLPAARRCRQFGEPKVGMVQARWGHINRDYSLLTQLQSILLDGHFVLEHGGRNRAGASSTSTAPPASGAARRSPTRAAGSTTRSPRTSTSATARSSRAGSSSSCPTSSRPPRCRSR